MQECLRLAGLFAACHKIKPLVFATAESCTGGLVSAAITSVQGSSQWFDRAFITYSNEAKQTMLDVSPDILEQFGAVSEETVRAMVQGALRHSRADVAVAISGIAGPGGGSALKPVGTVWMAFGQKNLSKERYTAKIFHFKGDRQAVRNQAACEALRGLLTCAGFSNMLD